MGTTYEYNREAIRVKAIKYGGNDMPDMRKFSVDPRLTTYNVLKSILTKAFDIQQDFSMYYRVLDDYKQEAYIPLLSDWDLDAAFLRAADPCLCLKVDMKIYEEVAKEWPAQSTSLSSWITDSKRLQDLIMNHVEKTVSVVKGALNFIEDSQLAQEVLNQPSQNPINDSDFRKYLNDIGQLVKADEMKNAVYFGGVEPSLRKVAWKHLLNVYPVDLSGKQRIDYIKKKSNEYEHLKNSWRDVTNDDKMKQDLALVTSMVKKDVLRTDRQHYFFAGKDDNQNIVSLFNILTTYALNHPSVSYCQGMSDLASPLLVTMDNEAHAYICFCSLMRRLSPNFLIDGVTMTQRFQHLADGLLYYDPTFYAYLKAHQADDLLFCYRWLLLEMKREFAFEDALRMLEVMWSSLPPVKMSEELPLYEVRFCSNSQFLPPPSPNPRETPYTKVCALRRQTSSGKPSMINRSLDESVIAKRRLRSSMHNVSKKYNSLDDSAIFGENTKTAELLKSHNTTTSATSSSKEPPNEPVPKKEVPSTLPIKPSSTKIVKNLNEFLTLDKKGRKCNKDGSVDDNSSPDDSSEYYPMTTSLTQKLSKDLENLEKQVFCAEQEENEKDKDDASKGNGEEVFIWENPLKDEVAHAENQDPGKNNKSNVSVPSTQIHHAGNSVNGERSNFNECELGSTFKSRDMVVLPGPTEFGGGNPFLMFLCIAVLRQHRDTIMKSNMDYNEIAMHFDKMVRKHNVNRVLSHARTMYAMYLKEHRQNYLKV